jgi:hypothetical protein
MNMPRLRAANWMLLSTSVFYTILTVLRSWPTSPLNLLKLVSRAPIRWVADSTVITTSWCWPLRLLFSVSTVLKCREVTDEVLMIHGFFCIVHECSNHDQPSSERPLQLSELTYESSSNCVTHSQFQRLVVSYDLLDVVLHFHKT